MSKTTNIKVLGIALFAVFAFSAIAAASAFAADEWLFNELTFTGELATNTESMLVLLPAVGATELNTIDCSGLFEGTVTGSSSLALVLDLFSLTGTLIEELGGASLDCETLTNPTGSGCPIGGETLIWVENLSLALGLQWEASIELMAAEPIFLLHFTSVAFEQLCIIGGTNVEFLCEGLTSGQLVNVTGGVLLEFNQAAPISSERLTCPVSPVAGVEVGLQGDLIIKHSTGGTLSVS